MIDTERLYIRLPRLSDGDFLLALMNSNPWITNIGDRNIKEVEDARTYITESLLRSYDDHGFTLYIMVDRERDEPIGLCGFVQRDYLDRPDLGFAVAERYARKGYTYEAAKALMNYGQKELGFTSLYAITAQHNIPSQGLLRKLGFQLASSQFMPIDKDKLRLFSYEF